MSTLWCPHCSKMAIVTLISGTSDSRCNLCNQVIGDQFRIVHKSKKRPTEKRSKKQVKKSVQNHRKKNSIKKPIESDHPEYRFDVGHTGPDSQQQFAPTTGNAALRETKNPKPPPTPSTVPPIHLASFGIFLFLVGQILSVWAFVDGSFVAYTIGNLISVTAVVVSLWTLTTQLQSTLLDGLRLRKRVAKLERRQNREGEAFDPVPRPKLAGKSRRKKSTRLE